MTEKRRFPFYQVDAFTTTPLTGNACAVVLDADGLDEAAMLAIAREMNLSETAFVFPSSAADFGVRYFTPAEEIPMAGHPTLATTYALVEAGRFNLHGTRTTLTLEMPAGVLPVEIIAGEQGVEWMVMTQAQPRFLRQYDPVEILPEFGLPPSAVLPDVPIQTVSTGTPQLMVPLSSMEALRQVRVDGRSYQALRQQSDFFSAHFFVLEGATPLGRTFARHFSPPPDVLEDPFTGSATGGMAAYLWFYGLIKTPKFIAEQGHWMFRPGQAQVDVVGSPSAITAVRVGGSAVTVLHGELVV
jgi:trans-2,3-dihydro-3-hydroxyanthranilate isomerase